MPTLRFTPDSKPGGNTSGATTDAVADKIDLGSTDPTSQVRVSYNVLLQVDKQTVDVQDFPQVGGDSKLPSEV